jgi:hypothetical protein
LPNSGRKPIGKHLEFLHGVLRDLGGDASAPGVLVVETLGGVVPVRQKGVASGDAAKADQAKGPIVGHGGSQQYERVSAAAIDRQIVDLELLHNLRDSGLGVLHQRRFARHQHLRAGRPNFESHYEVHSLADQDLEVLHFPAPETFPRHDDGVARSGLQRGRRKDTRFRGFHRAFDAF